MAALEEGSGTMANADEADIVEEAVTMSDVEQANTEGGAGSVINQLHKLSEILI